MRFDELLLERYGAFERQALSFVSPGLTVVYGPNEAGKSTCLRAIRDFLFKIQEGSWQVATFGSGAARIRASLTTAAGSKLALRRQYGRVRTLVDEEGKPCGDEVLSSLLGSTDRGRFTRLFGLDHDDLRNGGNELLKADGDFGRLIVEAGGGLRALIGKLAAIDREIDDLFALRRKESRAFYKSLDAYEIADKTLRAATLTSEAHERDLKTHEGATREVAEVKRAKREVSETSSRMRRVERVLPLLRRLDQVEATLLGHVDVAALPEDFAQRCGLLIAEAEEASVRLGEARSRHDSAARRLAEMVVDEALGASEVEVRDLAERAAVVRAARGDAGKRSEELAGAEAHLDQLRTLLDLGRDVDLSSVMPSPAALASVRELADRKTGLDSRLAGAGQDIARHARAVSGAEERIASLAADGRHEPFGMSPAVLAAVPSAWAAADQFGAEAQGAAEAVQGLATHLDLADARSATLLRCPTEDQAKAEVTVRDALAVEIARLGTAKAHAEIERGAALAEVDSLRRDGEVATQERLVVSRRVRDDAWAPIRSSYLGERPSPPEQERRARVEAFERGVSEADLTSDRRSAEAERAAALNQAHRRAAEAETVIRANADAEVRLLLQIAGRDRTLREAFPEVYERYPDPVSMLAFAVQLSKLAELAERADEGRRRAEAAYAQLAPAVTLLEFAERRAGIVLTRDQDPVARVLRATEAIVAHDRDHDEHLRRTQGMPSLREELAEAELRLARLVEDLSNWSEAWAGATRAIGLPPDASVARASDVAALWAGARGDMRSVERLRAALSRMVEDEGVLAAGTAAVADRLSIDLPADPVAAGIMLMERWAKNDAARIRRETFSPEVDAARIDVDRCEDRAGRAEEALALACVEARIDGGHAMLRGIATKRGAFDALRSERDGLVDAVRAAGDGLTLPVLQAEVGTLDLDAVRAEVADLDAQSETLDARGEAAIAQELRTATTLRANEGPSPGASLVSAREGAVTDMHQTIERHLELRLAKYLVEEAIRVVREERQDPLVRDAGALLSRMTHGEYIGVAADVDESGRPVVVGVRSGGRGTRTALEMSDGTRDQLFLAFRLASLKAYCASAESLPFVADDILVHFDDERSEATLELLSEFAATTQVLLFTHHRSVLRVAERLAGNGRASVAIIGP